MKKDIIYLGYCANCYADIIKDDPMDCCGNLELIPLNSHRDHLDGTDPCLFSATCLGTDLDSDLPQLEQVVRPLY